MNNIGNPAGDSPLVLLLRQLGMQETADTLLREIAAMQTLSAGDVRGGPTGEIVPEDEVPRSTHVAADAETSNLLQLARFAAVGAIAPSHLREEARSAGVVSFASSVLVASNILHVEMQRYHHQRKVCESSCTPSWPDTERSTLLHLFMIEAALDIVFSDMDAALPLAQCRSAVNVLLAAHQRYVNQFLQLDFLNCSAAAQPNGDGDDGAKTATNELRQVVSSQILRRSERVVARTMASLSKKQMRRAQAPPDSRAALLRILEEPSSDQGAPAPPPCAYPPLPMDARRTLRWLCCMAPFLSVRQQGSLCLLAADALHDAANTAAPIGRGAFLSSVPDQLRALSRKFLLHAEGSPLPCETVAAGLKGLIDSNNNNSDEQSIRLAKTPAAVAAASSVSERIEDLKSSCILNFGGDAFARCRAAEKHCEDRCSAQEANGGASDGGTNDTTETTASPQEINDVDADEPVDVVASDDGTRWAILTKQLRCIVFEYSAVPTSLVVLVAMNLSSEGGAYRSMPSPPAEGSTLRFAPGRNDVLAACLKMKPQDGDANDVMVVGVFDAVLICIPASPQRPSLTWHSIHGGLGIGSACWVTPPSASHAPSTEADATGISLPLLSRYEVVSACAGDTRMMYRWNAHSGIILQRMTFPHCIDCVYSALSESLYVIDSRGVLSALDMWSYDDVEYTRSPVLRTEDCNLHRIRTSDAAPTPALRRTAAWVGPSTDVPLVNDMFRGPRALGWSRPPSDHQPAGSADASVGAACYASVSLGQQVIDGVTSRDVPMGFRPAVKRDRSGRHVEPTTKCMWVPSGTRIAFTFSSGDRNRAAPSATRGDGAIAASVLERREVVGLTLLSMCLPSGPDKEVRQRYLVLMAADEASRVAHEDSPSTVLPGFYMVVVFDTVMGHAVREIPVCPTSLPPDSQFLPSPVQREKIFLLRACCWWMADAEVAAATAGEESASRLVVCVGGISQTLHLFDGLSGVKYHEVALTNTSVANAPGAPTSQCLQQSKSNIAGPAAYNSESDDGDEDDEDNCSFTKSLLDALPSGGGAATAPDNTRWLEALIDLCVNPSKHAERNHHLRTRLQRQTCYAKPLAGQQQQEQVSDDSACHNFLRSTAAAGGGGLGLGGDCSVPAATVSVENCFRAINSVACGARGGQLLLLTCDDAKLVHAINI